MCGLIAGLLLVLAGGPRQSWATWLADAIGHGRIDAEAVSPGAVPLSVAVGRAVLVSWGEAELTSGDPVQGYRVTRYPEVGATPAPMTTNCTGVVTGLSCVETDVPPGLWRYTVTPVHYGWSGAESAFGAVVAVGDSTLTITSATTIAATSLPAAMTADLSEFLPGEGLSFRLDSPVGPVLAGNPLSAGPAGTASVAVTIPVGTFGGAHQLFVVGAEGSVASALFTVVDSPMLTALQVLDTNANGKVDRVVAGFSEALAAPYTAGTTGWTLTDTPSGATLTSVAIAGSTATLTLAEGGGAPTTAVGTFRIALAATSGGIRDAAGNQSSFAATAPSDAARPVRISQRGLDVDLDGKFDRVDVLFSEALGTYAPSPTPWALSNAPAGTSLASVTVSGATASLHLVEGTTFTTAVGSWRVALAAAAAGAVDPAGNQASFAATAITDAAAPAPVTLTTRDLTGGDGVVDRVAVVFSESLAAYSAGVTPWTLANTPSGTSLTAAARSGATMNLTLASPTGPGDTAVGAFTVALAASATGVRDAAGNLTSFVARAPADGAGPAVLSLSTVSGAIAGRIAPGDLLSVRLSEPLGPAVVLLAGTTLTMTDPPGNGSDTLTVPGLFNGARSTGSNSYVTVNSTAAAFAASSLGLSADRTTITVTVGPVCAGTGCGGLGTAAAANVSVLLEPSLRDAAGVAPTTTARNISIRLF